MSSSFSIGWGQRALCFGAWLCLACSGNSGYGDAPGASGLQVSLERHLGPPQSEVLLLVVDDRPEAAALVAELRRSLEALSERPLAPQTQCRLEEDPAASHPIDWSAVVVHPSATGDAIYTSPAQLPALRWAESERSEAGRIAWLEALETALGTVPAEPGAFAALDAFQRSAGLLSGARAAASSAETALLESLPSERTLQASLIVAAEDESAEEAGSYAVSLGPHGALDALLVPGDESAEEGALCRFGKSAAAQRLAEWLAAQGAVEWALWPCTTTSLFRRVSDESCEEQCVDFRPLRDDDGTAACLVLIDSAAERCDEAAGWLDPQGDDGVRRPLVSPGEHGSVRTCEVRQLAGSALASCQNELSCAGCEPGWCLTNVPSLQVACPQKRAFPLRFVGGADVAASGVATVVCNATR